MIKRINKIKNFGIYKDLTFCAPEFKKYNLFYGWNYSGKTTLSRLFRCIELQQIHMDFPDAEFELIDYENNNIKQNKLDGSKCQFRVFNTDFIYDNLYWDNQEANPIFVLGEEDIELQKQIEELDETIGDLQEDKTELEQQRTNIETDLEKKLTDKSRELSRIKSPYNKAKLKKTLESHQANLDEYCLNENDLSIHRETINAPSKEKLSIIQLKFLDKSKMEQIEEILDRTVISETIEKLKNNPELNNWVQKGLELHKGKKHCDFCGNQLTNDLLITYEKHFSKEYEKMLLELNRQARDVNNFKISISFPDEKRLYPQVENDYRISRSKFNKCITEYNETIEKLISLLNEKIANPFNKYAGNAFQVDTTIFINVLEEYNEVITRHNKICDNFENEQLEAFRKVELHYAAEFNIDNNYILNITELEKLDTEINHINENIAKCKQLVHQKESKLSDVGKAADKISGELHSIFGRGHIKLEAVENNKFRILRDGREAKNLSEGEKTAIAFSYFLTRLEDQETDISKAIVFIDDPISSLDSNHLYNTFAIIKAKLENCNQLFISTHNFEFFNLIKDWFSDIKKKKCCYYLIERTVKDANEVSNINELPLFLLNYKSEYHYLFYKIKSFDSCPTTDFENLYQLPNIIRRFLEAFVGFKYAVGVKKGLEILITNESERIKIDKFVNNFSHQSGLSRSLVLTDVNECKSIVHIVLEAVKNKDSEHYNCLEEIYNTTIAQL